MADGRQAGDVGTYFYSFMYLPIEFGITTPNLVTLSFKIVTKNEALTSARAKPTTTFKTLIGFPRTPANVQINVADTFSVGDTFLFSLTSTAGSTSAPVTVTKNGDPFYTTTATLTNDGNYLCLELYKLGVTVEDIVFDVNGETAVNGVSDSSVWLPTASGVPWDVGPISVSFIDVPDLALEAVIGGGVIVQPLTLSLDVRDSVEGIVRVKPLQLKLKISSVESIKTQDLNLVLFTDANAFSFSESSNWCGQSI